MLSTARVKRFWKTSHRLCITFDIIWNFQPTYYLCQHVFTADTFFSPQRERPTIAAYSTSPSLPISLCLYIHFGVTGLTGSYHPSSSRRWKKIWLLIVRWLWKNNRSFSCSIKKIQKQWASTLIHKQQKINIDFKILLRDRVRVWLINSIANLQTSRYHVAYPWF